MSDPMIIATAIAFVIASIGGVIVQVINARAAVEERREAKISRIKIEKETEIASIKADRIIDQGTAIHILTNSNLSKVTSSLDTALSKIEVLERLITSQSEAKKVADALAATVITPITTVVVPKVLEEIKDNTENTVQAVKDLNLKKGK